MVYNTTFLMSLIASFVQKNELENVDSIKKYLITS